MDSNQFIKHDAQYKASVMYDTWGHLDAKPDVVYPCSFYIAKGDRESLVFKEKCEVHGPAFYNDIGNYAYDKVTSNKSKPEGVYYFEGTYQMYKRHPKNTEMIGYFKGKLIPVSLKPRKEK